MSDINTNEKGLNKKTKIAILSIIGVVACGSGAMLLLGGDPDTGTSKGSVSRKL